MSLKKWTKMKFTKKETLLAKKDVESWYRATMKWFIAIWCNSDETSNK